MKSHRMTTYILAPRDSNVGDRCRRPDPRPVWGRPRRNCLPPYISIGSMIFLRLIKMIIAPLVFSTLVVGIGHMSDAGAVGRVGGKAMLWFVQRLPGLANAQPHSLVSVFEPGVGAFAKGRQQGEFGDRRARHDVGRLRQTCLPGFGDPSDG